MIFPTFYEIKICTLCIPYVVPSIDDVDTYVSPDRLHLCCLAGDSMRIWILQEST